MLAERAGRSPGRPFLHWEPFEGEPIEWTYGEFHEAVKSVAAGLIAAGLGVGDRLLLHAENSPELLMAWFASAMVGSIAVTTNAAASGRELQYYAQQSGATFAICDTERRDLVAQLADLQTAWVIGGAGDLQLRAFGDLFGSVPDAPLLERDWRRPLSIQFTSGSTSLPKAVLWTHGNAIWGARVSAQHQRLEQDDVFLVFLPFSHANAQTYSVLPALWASARIVLQPKFSASRFWQVSLKHGVTRTSMVPFCLRALLEHPHPENHSYRTWGLGVSHPAAQERFGIKILGWWGMTETIAQPIVSDHGADHPYMSMGYASLAYEIDIRDENGSVAIGETGHLHVRGERGVSIFLEYAGDSSATAASFTDDGWFRTGDRAHFGPSGEVYFDGRLSDMIKCGGENVSASEIELILAAVEGVREAAVIGLPDRMYGEVPIAYLIVAAPSEDLEARILMHCREQLAPYKIPRAFKIVDDLPRTALNKVAKSKLVEIAAAAASD